MNKGLRSFCMHGPFSELSPMIGFQPPLEPQNSLRPNVAAFGYWQILRKP